MPTTKIYTLSLHDALPISGRGRRAATPANSIDIRGVRPLVELDIGAPRVGDERERSAGLLIFGVGPVELDSVGFALLDERLQVLHVEADVVEQAPFGGPLRRLDLVPAE